MPATAGDDDARCAERISEGDRAALGELYDRHAAQLLALARRVLGDATEAEDLVHDVFVEVWHGAGRYRPERGSVRTWLVVRTRSRALDRLRLRAQRRPPPEAARAAPEAAGEPPGAADRVAVARALAALPADQRRALELAYYAGLSAAEIAAELGAPLGTVKSRLAGALGRLRHSLQDERPEEDRA